jgi:hypothetical protein
MAVFRTYGAGITPASFTAGSLDIVYLKVFVKYAGIVRANLNKNNMAVKSFKFWW